MSMTLPCFPSLTRRAPALARLTLALAATAWAPLAAADINLTFDSDAQGVSLVGDGTLTHVAAGYLSVADTNGNTDVYLSLPLGAAVVDWSGFLGGTFSFDGIMLNGITPSWPDFGIVRFTSATDQTAWADLAPGLTPGTTWATYSGRLDAATFNQGSASLASVLGNLKSVTLSLEAGNGPVEVVGVDNLRISAVPEPQSWLMGLVGLMALGASALRKRVA